MLSFYLSVEKMASNTELRILVDILVKQNLVLRRKNKKEMEDANAEMEKRDRLRLEYRDRHEKEPSQEMVRLLNKCKCCKRHQFNKIKPIDFDNEKEEMLQSVFGPSDDSWVIRGDGVKISCGCDCRHKTRKIYREYYSCYVSR